MEKSYLPVGIPARNSESTIESTLNSFLEADLPENLERKIIVCANDCSDMTEEIVTKMAKKHPEIELISTKKAGKANAWNLIMESAGDSDFIVFGDDDVVVDKQAIRLLYEDLVNNSYLAVSTAYPKIKSSDEGLGMRLMNSIYSKIPLKQSVCGGLYIIRRGIVERMPEHIINEDGWLTLNLGRERIKRNMDALIYFDPPKTVRDYFECRTRAEMGKCQLKKYPELEQSIDRQLGRERLYLFLKNLELKDWLYSPLSFPLFASIICSSKIKAALGFNPNKIISEWRESESSKSKKFLKNILFKQERVGKGGKIFNMYKFRTMVLDAEKDFDEAIVKNWPDEGYSKLGYDPRVTKFGKFLRASFMDEIPQIVNVARREMSIVGPRPLRKCLFDKLPEHIQEQRKKYRPGWMPVIYADRKTLESLSYKDQVKSEEKYFERKKLLGPIPNDIIYFSKITYNILHNILFRRARGV